MKHEDAIETIEDPRLGENDLPPDRLLGGGPDHLELEIVAGLREPRHRKRRAETRGGDEMMAAPVSDPRQRVVLGEERHARPRRARALDRAKRRRKTARSPFDGEPARFEQRGAPFGGVMLLARELRIGP